MKITKRQIRKLIRESLEFPKDSSTLPSPEEERLRYEYESNPNSDRYKRVVFTSMADAMYGTRGSVVLDQQENVHLMFTYHAGSGGSLGT